MEHTIITGKKRSKWYPFYRHPFTYKIVWNPIRRYKIYRFEKWIYNELKKEYFKAVDDAMLHGSKKTCPGTALQDLLDNGELE